MIGYVLTEWVLSHYKALWLSGRERVSLWAQNVYGPEGVTSRTSGWVRGVGVQKEADVVQGVK